MDKDRVIGLAKQVKGAVKQAVGKAVGDAKLRTGRGDVGGNVGGSLFQRISDFAEHYADLRSNQGHRSNDE